MPRTYDFATIGFRPFTETQEFVTMGVVANRKPTKSSSSPVCRRARY
jgi:hypothetical protein